MADIGVHQVMTAYGSPLPSTGLRGKLGLKGVAVHQACNKTECQSLLIQVLRQTGATVDVSIHLLKQKLKAEWGPD